MAFLGHLTQTRELLTTISRRLLLGQGLILSVD